MGINLMNKYVWLVETIQRAGEISLKEIQSRWLDSDLSEGVELSQRTFHKWRIATEELFGICIDCQRTGGYNYYIANAEVLNEGGIRSWLLRTASLNQQLARSMSLNERILLEDIPSSETYLSDIIRAMKACRCIQVKYRRYTSASSRISILEPYALKLFKQRWYLLAKASDMPYLLLYSLDRMEEVVLTETKFQLSPDFDAETFFEDCYGTIIDATVEAERISIRVTSSQACYLKSLPLHHSQRLLSEDEEYSVFELYLKPTYDFLQALLSYGSELEVIAPVSLRNQMQEEVAAMMSHYR